MKLPVSRDCPLCHSSQFKCFRQMGEWSLRRCVVCKLVMLNPQPTPDALAALYDSPAYFAERIQKTPSSGLVQKRVAELSLEFVHLIHRTQPGRILEIGCGYGFVLAAAERRGWEALGLEISPHATKFARDTFGVNVIEASAEHLDSLNLGSFD